MKQILISEEDRAIYNNCQKETCLYCGREKRDLCRAVRDEEIKNKKQNMKLRFIPDWSKKKGPLAS